MYIRKIFRFILLSFLFVFISNVFINSQQNSEVINLEQSSQVDNDLQPILTPNISDISILEPTIIYGNTNSIEASDNGDYKFSFLLENNYIISTSKTYQFRSTRNHNFLAFFRPSSKHQVLFVDANNTYLGSLLVEPGTIINESDIEKITARVTNKPGYEFAGWSLDLPLAANKPLTIVKAQYNKTTTETATLTITSTQAETIIMEDIPYGSTVELIVPTPTLLFMKFSHWQVGEEVLSYNPHHKISLYGDLTVTAHYEFSLPTPTPVSYLQETYIQDESRLYFFSQNYIPEGYSVIEQGLLLLDTIDEYSNNIDINTVDVVRLRANRVSPNNEFAVLKDTLHSDKIYYRAYLVVKNSSGEFEYFYSRQQEMSFKFTVNYNLNGGVNHPNNSNQYSVYDNKQLFAPTKAGYEFGGWYLDDDFKQHITDVSDLTTDTTLFAKWNYITHRINYETNGGNFNFTKDELINEFLLDYYEFVNPAMTFTEFFHSSSEEEDFLGPWRDYRLFGGTYKNIINYLYANGDKSVHENSEYFLNDYRYNAKWLPFFEMVAELSNDTTTFWSSSELGSHEIYLYITKSEYQEEKNLPENFSSYPPKYYTSQAGLRLPTPIKDGFKFAGWYDNENFDGSVITKINPGEEGSRQYYAKWTEEGLEEEFTINYNLNGGSLLEEVNTFTESDLPLSLPIPAKDGYEFIGWFLDEEFTIPLINLDNLKNIKVYAKWIEYVEYNIDYTLDGGLLSDEITIFSNNDLPLSLPIPTKEHYKFIGWYLDKDYTSNKITKITSLQDYHLYAKWEATNYNIEYNLNDGILSTPINSFTIEDLSLVLPTPTKDHFTFLGWYENAEFKGSSISEITAGKNYQLYAKWEAVKYNILYDLDGGQLASPTNSFTVTDLSIILPIPTKDHFIFLGWYEKADFAGASISEISEARNYQLYAKWETITYNIEYHLNGGLLTEPISSFNIENYPITLPIPEKDNYEFIGWYDNKEFSGEVITAITLLQNYKLYAKWQQANYSISYELNDGFLENPITSYKIKDLPLTLQKPSRLHYDFLGWYDNSNFEGNAISRITDAANYRLYAKWQKTEYTINYHLNGGLINNPQQVFTHTDLPVNLPSPTKDHFAFRGWYLDSSFSGNKLTEITTAQHYELYAKWEPIKYTVNYHLNGGSLPNQINEYTYADLPLLLPIPSKDNHLFIGWYTNRNFNGSNIKTITIDTLGNLELFAKWEEDYRDFNLEFVLNGGRIGYSKEQLKIDFLTDYHEFLGSSLSLSDFMHGKGNSSGYEGPWAIPSGGTVAIERLYTAGKKGVDPNSNLFINQPEYNAKWKPFFDLIDRLVTDQNPEQDFWNSTWTGNLRLRQYFTGFFWSNNNELPPNFENISVPTKYNSKLGIDLPTPIRDKYTFLGWYSNPNFTGSAVSKINPGQTGDRVFYARWNDTRYQILYNLNGGTLANPINSYDVADLPLTLPIPTKSGYSFDGWYTNASFNGPKVTTLTTEITGNQNFYAKWIEGDINMNNHIFIDRATDMRASGMSNVRLSNGKLVLSNNVTTGYYKSPVINTRDFTDLVGSWSAITNTQNSVELEISVLIGSSWSGYLSYGRWGLGQKNKSISKTLGSAKMDTDHLLITNSRRAKAFQYKITLRRNNLNVTSPKVSLVAATINIPGYNSTVDMSQVPAIKVYNVPQLNQNKVPDIGDSICSPTSITMLLKFKGEDFREHDAEYEHRYVAGLARDYGAKIYGNWVYNVAVMGAYGYNAYVKRMYNLDELKHHLATVGPVAISVRGDMGPYNTNGHLLVLRGYTKKGNTEYFIANDPNIESVYYEFPAKTINDTWRKIVYVIE